MSQPTFLAASVAIIAVLTAIAPAQAAEPCLAELEPSVTAGPPDVVYRRGRDAFEGRRWLEAGAISRHVALEHPTHEVGPYAVQLALEAANQAGREGALAGACSARMASDLPAYQASYCGAGTKHAEPPRGLPWGRIPGDPHGETEARLTASAASQGGGTAW